MNWTDDQTLYKTLIFDELSGNTNRYYGLYHELYIIKEVLIKNLNQLIFV